VTLTAFSACHCRAFAFRQTLRSLVLYFFFISLMFVFLPFCFCFSLSLTITPCTALQSRTPDRRLPSMFRTRTNSNSSSGSGSRSSSIGYNPHTGKHVRASLWARVQHSCFTGTSIVVMAAAGGGRPCFEHQGKCWRTLDVWRKKPSWENNAPIFPVPLRKRSFVELKKWKPDALVWRRLNDTQFRQSAEHYQHPLGNE